MAHHSLSPRVSKHSPASMISLLQKHERGKFSLVKSGNYHFGLTANIEYHLNNGVDMAIITDNGSVDGTYELCKSYLNNGVVEIIQEPPNVWNQDVFVSRMANLASSKYKADWVIHSDADEFFVTREHRDLKAALADIPREFSIVSLIRHNFVPIANNYTAFSPKLFPYRKRISLNSKGQPLPPKVIHRSSTNIWVATGNHSVKGDDLSEVIKDTGIEVLHFPHRSYDQFKSKVRNLASGYEKSKKYMGDQLKYECGLLLKGELKIVFDKLFFGDKKLSEALADSFLVEDNFLSTLRPFSNWK